MSKEKIYPNASWSVGNERKIWQLHKLTNHLAQTHCPANVHSCIYRQPTAYGIFCLAGGMCEAQVIAEEDKEPRIEGVNL